MYQYNNRLYDWIDKMTWQDAEIILAYVMKWLNPTSIVDFGCGEGLWLESAKRLDAGISIWGLDGDYIDRERLRIPKEVFQAVDLGKPLKLNTKFDLAISTEVAEHINLQDSEQFIDNLTNASDNILFSAAIPGQGGINHVNEQWQGYWVDMFIKRGFFVDLSVRNFFWNDERITDWRKQNLLFFSKHDNIHIAPSKSCYDIVHPNSFNILYKRLIESNTQYVYSITNLEICIKLDNAISKIIRDHENIVIYPYGRNGKICKLLLNTRWRKAEYALVDNVAYKNNENIFPASSLESLEEEYVVIDTCNNSEIHKEVLTELRRYVKEKNIYSVFEME